MSQGPQEAPPSLTERVRRYVAGDVTVVDEISALFDRIERHEPTIHAFMHTDRSAALAHAAELDRSLRRGDPPGPLHGVALAVKDNMDLAGWVSTAGSIVRTGHVARTTAPCVAALVDAGAVVVGKTMLDEWAFGGSTENPHFGRVANPWALDRTSGGSSGGSAAAVSAGFAHLALGSDTGGSVRLPAALCGVVGFKPTLGHLPLDGVEPLAPTYDTWGVFTHRVEDALLWLQVLEGVDRPGVREGHATQLHVLRPASLPPTDPDIVRVFEDSLSLCEQAGALIEDVSLPWLWEIPEHFRPVVLRELARGHAGLRRADVARYGQPLQESIAQGDLVDDVTYERALAFRDEVRMRFARLLEGRENAVLATPMTARPADPQGISFNDVVRWGDGMEEDYFSVSTRYTLFANVLGAPALTLPVMGTHPPLPVGLQITGAPGRDHAVLGAGMTAQRSWGGPYLPLL